jgi:hypothetical protein
VKFASTLEALFASCHVVPSNDHKSAIDATLKLINFLKERIFNLPKINIHLPTITYCQHYLLLHKAKLCVLCYQCTLPQHILRLALVSERVSIVPAPKVNLDWLFVNIHIYIA